MSVRCFPTYRSPGTCSYASRAFTTAHSTFLPVLTSLPSQLRPVASLGLSLRAEQVLTEADGLTSGLWLEGHLYDEQQARPVETWEARLDVLHESLTLTHITHLHIYIDPAHTFWSFKENKMKSTEGRQGKGMGRD